MKVILSYGIEVNEKEITIIENKVPLKKWCPFHWRGRKYVLLQPVKGVFEIYRVKKGWKEYMMGPLKLHGIVKRRKT